MLIKIEAHPHVFISVPIEALADAGIKLFGGVSGDCDEAVKAFVEGNLGYNPNVKCNHHDHEHGEGERTCGEHGCGSHNCGGHNCH